jgi:hypothetical protein
LYCKCVHWAIHSPSHRFQHPGDVDRCPPHSDEQLHLHATEQEAHRAALRGSLDSRANHRYALLVPSNTHLRKIPLTDPRLTTANVALGLDAYGPTSGNWCWITPKHVTLRYSLTHGWRIAIFLTTICIYTYVYIRLTKTYGNIWARTNESFSRATEGTAEDESQLCPTATSGLPDTPTTIKGESETRTDSYIIQLKNISPPKRGGHTTTAATTTISTVDTNDSTRIHSSRNRELRRFLLLNGYPILYLLLWIPGMANRASELAHGKSPTWLQALQATTQLIGLANVLTYALTEKFVGRLRKRFGRRREGFERTG